MRTSFLLALAGIVTLAKGQGLYPLGIDDLWQYWEVPGQYWEVEVVDDTLMLNDSTYMVLTGYGGGFFRQSGPLVLSYNPTLNEETIVYDFSKTTGDTVAIHYFPGDTILVTVYSDQMETHFGRTLRTWVFHEMSSGSTYYAFRQVADSLGLLSVQGEGGLSYGLQGAIINGIQYGVILDVSAEEKPQPARFALSENYPNPFNPSTTIGYSLPRSAFVTLRIFNSIGVEIAVLVSGNVAGGNHEIIWDAGASPSGVYFYRLQADGFSETKKSLLLK